MLTIYRRHLRKCAHRREGRQYRRCKCPIWVDGMIGARKIRQSLRLQDWQKAQNTIREWEAEGTITHEAAPMTITEAWQQYLHDAEARGLRPPTLYKYRLLERVMLAFARDRGLHYLPEFDVEMTRAFRASWPLRNLAAGRRLEHLRAFFRFAQESKWVSDNPAKRLKSPKVVAPPTLPFSREQMSAILTACDSHKLRALVLLLRYSGLRMSDAVSLAANRITDGKLLLFTAKTGTPVYCPLPAFLLTELEAVKRPNGCFFWTGASNIASVAGNWRRRLAHVFTAANVENGHPHRFRDTFAVELLLAGVPLERVSVLLGHSSTRITEKHYAPWVRDRQIQLEADVRRTWAADAEAATKGTLEVHGGRGLVN